MSNYMSTEGEDLGNCGDPSCDLCRNSKTILERAADAVFNDRQENYGHPSRNFARIASLWNAYLSQYGTTKIASEDVAIMMILMKVARLIETPDHEDSIVDIAGYAEAYARMLGIDK